MGNYAPPDYTAHELALQDTVGFGEGTIKQDANGNWVRNPKLWFGYKDHVDPTKLNFHQLIEAQKSFLRAGKGRFYGGDSAAVGWPQMTYPETYVAAAGLKMTDLFTEKNQNKLFLQYAAKEAGVTPEMLAKQGFTREISTRLGKPWASMWGSKHGQKTKPYESLRDFFNQRLKYHQQNIQKTKLETKASQARLNDKKNLPRGTHAKLKGKDVYWPGNVPGANWWSKKAYNDYFKKGKHLHAIQRPLYNLTGGAKELMIK